MRIVRILLILIFSSPLCSNAWAVCDSNICYVTSSGGATSGDCPSGTPCTPTYAIETVAVSGDEVRFNDGAYGLPAPLVVPPVVSLTAVNQTYPNPTVRLYPTANMSIYNPMLKLYSAAGTNGNQTISYLEIDGRDSGYVAYQGIGIESRDNVTIEYNYIHDHYGTYSAACIRAESVQITPTDEWWDLWPPDPGTLGNDSTIYAVWPDTNAMESLEIANNTIVDGGFEEPAGNARTGAVQIWHLKDSTIHHNTITTTVVSQGQCITGAGPKTGLLDNVDIYNNTLNIYQINGTSSNFAVETWIHRNGCEWYNNTATGGFSVTVGKESSFYNNTIIHPEPSTTLGLGIEFLSQSYGEVYGNYCANNSRGITFGGNDMSDGGVVRNVTVRNNAFYNTQYEGIEAKCRITAQTGRDITCTNLEAYFNVIDGGGSRGDDGMKIAQSAISGSSATMSNVNFENNVIMRVASNYAVLQIGSASGVSVDYNIFYDNDVDDCSGCTDTNTVFTNPNFQELGANLTGYTPIAPSDAIDGGTIISSLFYGSVPSYNGTAPEIGPVEVGGTDTTGPTISNKSPATGHIYDYGTTSAPLSIDASDASGMTGCKWDDTDVAYASMANTMSEASGTYTDTKTSLANDTSYTVYGICRDAVGTPNDTSFTWTFSVAPEPGDDIIIDNLDAEYSEGGTWVTSITAPNYYGADYRHNAANDDTNYATFTPDIVSAGTHEVYLWWTVTENRSDAVKVVINHAGGANTIYIDQTQNGGQWNLIGSWSFNTGTGGSVVVGATGGGVGIGEYVIADAAKFTFTSAGSGGGSSGVGTTIGGGSGYIRGR